jgi:hypothetical protein
MDFSALGRRVPNSAQYRKVALFRDDTPQRASVHNHVNERKVLLRK